MYPHDKDGSAWSNKGVNRLKNASEQISNQSNTHKVIDLLQNFMHKN